MHGKAKSRKALSWLSAVATNPCIARACSHARSLTAQVSMARRHRFITVKDMSWWNFNIVVFGLKQAPRQGTQKPELEKVCFPSTRTNSHYSLRCGDNADSHGCSPAAGNQTFGGPEKSGGNLPEAFTRLVTGSKRFGVVLSRLPQIERQFATQ